MIIIDSHARFSRGQPPARDFAPVDIEPRLRAIGADGVVAVQADPGGNFGDWLLGLAMAQASVRGVIGQVALEDPQFEGTLEWWSDRPKLRGVLARAADAALPGWERGLAALRRLDLVCDLDADGVALGTLAELIDRHPAQRFVLTHLGRPPLAQDALEPWRTQLRDLARRPNVACKVAGLVTVPREPRLRHEARLWPFYDTALSAFGPERLMFGSDWPAVHGIASYTAWFETVEMWIDVLTPGEQARVLGGTAVEVYRLSAWSGDSPKLASPLQSQI